VFAATLLVDASWCPNTGVAGYGYWIASDRGKLGGGAALQGILSSSNLAEMQAICNVIHIAKSKGLILPQEEVLVQTDCIAAILGLRNARPLNADEEQTRAKFAELTEDHLVVFRHVKAHTGRWEARFSANRKCDKRAKDAMRIARKEFHLEAHARQSC
jgi:ribonuclease HI